MAGTTAPVPSARPPSPWSGSQHRTRHRWQLDHVRHLFDAGIELRAIAAELTAAHTAGWWLVEPMYGGHLLAARASRRARARAAPAPPPPARTAGGPAYRWRLRVVDDAPVPGEETLAVAAVPRTAVLAWSGSAVEVVGGPPVRALDLAEVERQVTGTELGARRWALAPARAGPGYDLVAEGSALRAHAVRHGLLLRAHDALTLHHTADGACTLGDAAAAYERLADAVDAMTAQGGRLVGNDDGFLHVEYEREVR